MTFKQFSFEEAIRKVRESAEKKLARNKNADEFVQISEADDFKLYVVAGKTIRGKTTIFLFMKILAMFLCCCLKEAWSSRLKMEKRQP